VKCRELSGLHPTLYVR